MKENLYQADCDLVLEMQEAGVGVEEIIQYAQGALSDREVRGLIRGLERILQSSGSAGPSAETIREAEELARDLSFA